MNVNKGYTLVEVIVALAIMAIVGLMTTSLYLSITGYRTRKNEISNIKNNIHNIHEVYLSDPENWESVYYGIHGMPKSDYLLENGSKVLYYSQHFANLVDYETNYAIYYTYDYDDSSQTYQLTIDRITRKDKSLDSNINFGRWVKTS